MNSQAPSTPKTLAEVWRELSHRMLDPIGADRIQRQEMRRAFYAGANAAITIVTDNMSPSDEPTEADFALMDNLVKELNRFSEAVQSGRA